MSSTDAGGQRCITAAQSDRRSLAEAGFPVFIGGPNRSGTSLVRQLVGSHPEIALPPTEFEFFKQVAVPRGELSSREVYRFVDQILALPKVAEWQVDRGTVLRRAAVDRSERGLFVAVLRAYADKLQKARIGDKTTGSERHLKTFDRWFAGNYTFVHVIRHPVSTFASSRWYEGREHPLDPYVWVREWTRSVLIALDTLRSRHDRCVLVRYEDLIGSPIAELGRICSRAGIEYDDRMLTMADFDRTENSSFEHSASDYAGFIRTRDAVDRASRIPEAELLLLRQLSREAAALVGYDVDDETALKPFSCVKTPLEMRVRASFAVHRAARFASRSAARLTSKTLWAAVGPRTAANSP